MNFNTLTLYLVAGGLSLSLSLVLALFAYLRPGTRLLNSCALAIVILTLGFTVSGFGPSLPRWMTVVGTNMLLLVAGTVFYAGFAAFYAQRPLTPDRWGLGVVIATAIPFWYWGLIEPDGHYRSAVFSLASAVINGRTAWLLARGAWKQVRSLPTWALAALFAVSTVWMAVRGVSFLLVDPAPASQRGANPTAWTTVFWYIVLITGMVVCTIWMEFSQLRSRRKDDDYRSTALSGFVDYFRNRLLLLWATVLVLVIGVAGESGLLYTKAFEWEEARLSHVTKVSNDAFVHHSMQTINGADTILNSVRAVYALTGSVSETERFIQALRFDRSTIKDVQLIDAQGNILRSDVPVSNSVSVKNHDYFLFQKNTPGDRIFIGSVESELATGKYYFQLARRMNSGDGSFAGAILATIDPESFTRFFQQLMREGQSAAALLGIADRRLRALAPRQAAERWQIPLDSPLWDALEKSSAGSYQDTSMLDGIQRIYVYQKVGDLPLVMATGYSEADVRAGVHQRFRWILAGTLGALAVVVTLAALLTIEIRRRNDQDRFLAMLSHELKTPLSVLRMAMGFDGALSANTRKHAQQSVQDMDAIVERCLQVGRLEQRRNPGLAQICRLDEMLSELQAAQHEGQRLLVNAEGLPSITTDAALLRIALNNLIENALKYSPAASPVQLTALRHAHQDQPGILISVSNTVGSAGVPDPGQVFNKYYRSPRARSKTGSGLGLYLVRTAAAQLGGWVRLAPGISRVCFEFWVPS